MQNLAAAFAASASVHSDKPALYWGESQFSYRHHADHAAALAQMLVTRLGVRPGDRVGIWLKNCPEFVTALFGILGAGAVVVPRTRFAPVKTTADLFVLRRWVGVGQGW